MRSPELERDRRRGRGDDEVALVEGRLEVVRDLRPHALRAPVVGLVVAGGQREGAQHDPALHLVAEALRARALVQVEQRPVARSRPVADSVVARQVGRRLGGRDHVVGGDPVRRMGQPDLHHLPAELGDAVQGAVEDLADARLDPLGVGAELARHAEPQPLQIRATRQLHLLRQTERGRVAGVVADEVTQQQRRVGDRARQRTALVQRGGERDHAVAGDRAVGRLQSDDAAQRRRLTDRPAGVRADRPRREAGRHRSRRPSAGAAGNTLRVPRVAHDRRSRSSRSTSPSRTRPCSSCRASARPRPPAAARPSPCTAACVPRGCATRRSSARPPCRTGP